ncbi:Gfo/Idh/MocA family protein [Arthrobacter vasquezii]|nr:Gfo/Idh/MocA family oxidoreductase [Arthrobacter vasquezii]
MSLRWGVIGTGDISARLVPDLHSVAPESVTAVWGRSGGRAMQFASEQGIPFATSSREELLAREDIDIVYVATPAETHTDIALEALDAGKHVLVEKPMATSAADVDRIFERAQLAGRFVMEAMWMKFNPLHQEVMRRIDDGLIGEVRSVRASFGTPFRARGNKLTPAQGGSILLDRGIYPVTLAHWALGGAQVQSSAQTLSEEVDIAGHATLGFGADRFAHVAWSGVEFLDLSAAISGEHGWVTLEPMFWAGTVAHIHAGSAERIFVDPERVEYPRAGNGYQPMLTAVQSAIHDGLLEHPLHGRTSTIEVAQTLDTIARS